MTRAIRIAWPPLPRAAYAALPSGNARFTVIDMASRKYHVYSTRLSAQAFPQVLPVFEGALRSFPMPNPPEAHAMEEARLLKLEEKVAYQDKLIAELNDVVVSLRRETDALSARLRTFERELGSELGARDMPNEPPPHY